MKFAQPHFLWLLLALPPGLLLFLWWSGRQRQKLARQFIQARLLPNLTVGLSPARQRFRMACLVAAVACLILALARPQWGFTWEEVKQRGLDIVVALDVSKSMLAPDIAPNRLTRAKLAVQDLLQQARADRLGLVAFAGTAFLQCPLTLDDSIFRQSLDVLDVNVISQGGTALAEAIDTALTAFKEEDNYKVLVIFTDGEDHDSGALEAAQKAAKEGLRIFAVGVGTAEGELLRIKDAKGREDYIRDEQGNVVKSRLNETLLQQIAGATEGGFYLPLRGAKVMEVLYERGLAPLPKSESTEKFVRRYHERFHWPLGLAIVLLALEMLWPEARRSRSQEAQVHSHRKKGQREVTGSGAAARVALLAALIALPPRAAASPSSALRDYESGDFAAALKEYQRVLDKKRDDPRLQFNAGAAAYRSGQFDEAAKQFGHAATAPDLKLQEQAYYNLGNTLFRAGEAVPDPQKRTESWEGALKQYGSALKLNTNNADARFNRAFVRKKLEELKQQPQQPQSDKNQDNKDPNDQQQQNQQNQQDQPQDQKKDQPSQPDEQKKQPDQSQQQDQQQKEDSQSEQQKQPEQSPQKDQDKQEQPRPQPSEKQDENPPPSDEQQREAQARAAGQMTPQQARQLLDSLKGDEHLLPFKPEEKSTGRQRSMKDW